MKSINLPKAKHLAISCLLWALLSCGSVLALSTDKDQPIDIEADSVDLDDRKGISVYQGDVVVTQGSIRVTADKVTVHHQAHKPDRLEADGNPVTFRQRPDGKDTDIEGEAKRVEYEVDSELLYLIGNAVLTQGADSFKSDRITYDRTKAKVLAGAVAKGKERVRVTIESRNKPDAKQ